MKLRTENELYAALVVGGGGGRELEDHEVCVLDAVYAEVPDVRTSGEVALDVREIGGGGAVGDVGAGGRDGELATPVPALALRVNSPSNRLLRIRHGELILTKVKRAADHKPSCCRTRGSKISCRSCRVKAT